MAGSWTVHEAHVSRSGKTSPYYSWPTRFGTARSLASSCFGNQIGYTATPRLLWFVVQMSGKRHLQSSEPGDLVLHELIDLV
jgi:hypothetical protein